MQESVYQATRVDGRTGEQVEVTVLPAPHGVGVRLPDGTEEWWPFEKVVVRRTAAGLRLERGDGPEQILVLEDARLLAAMGKLNAPVVSGRGRTDAQETMIRLAAIGVALVLLLAAAVYWGFPLLVSGLARMVPLAVEEQIGKAALESLAPVQKRCRETALEEILTVLSRAALSNPYTFRVYVADDATVNAFATPGGNLVVFRGLLERTRRPEEAAAVLAHEMQHVIERHSVRGIIRGASIWMGLALVTGNAGDVLVHLAGTLGALHYQRSDEASADREGMKILERARVDPEAMVSMLELLAGVQGDLPGGTQYFSTHPLTRERMVEMRAMAREYRGEVVPLMPGGKWPPAKGMCEVR